MRYMTYRHRDRGMSFGAGIAISSCTVVVCSSQPDRRILIKPEPFLRRAGRGSLHICRNRSLYDDSKIIIKSLIRSLIETWDVKNIPYQRILGHLSQSSAEESSSGVYPALVWEQSVTSCTQVTVLSLFHCRTDQNWTTARTEPYIEGLFVLIP